MVIGRYPSDLDVEKYGDGSSLPRVLTHGNGTLFGYRWVFYRNIMKSCLFL